MNHFDIVVFTIHLLRSHCSRNVCDKEEEETDIKCHGLTSLIRLLPILYRME